MAKKPLVATNDTAAFWEGNTYGRKSVFRACSPHVDEHPATRKCLFLTQAQGGSRQWTPGKAHPVRDTSK